MNFDYFCFFPDTDRVIDVERYKNFILSRERRALQEGNYTEVHHIVPKAFLKSLPRKLWDKNNTIRLTAREHYIAHLILAHAFPCLSTLKAFLCLLETNTSNQKRYQPATIKNSREYQKVREAYALQVSKSFKGTYKVYNPETEEMKTIQKSELPFWEERGWIRGLPKSLREKIRKSNTGKTLSEERKEAVSRQFSGTIRYQKYNEDGTRDILIVKDSETSYIPEGFQRGVDSTYRYIHRTNEEGLIEAKTIKKNECTPEGWEEGAGGYWCTICKKQNEEVISKSHFTANPLPEGWYKKKKNVKRKIKRCNPDGTIDYKVISSLQPIPEGWRSISSRNLVFNKHMVWGFRVKEEGIIENKRFTSKEEIPEGWFYGRGKCQTIDARNKISSKNKGYIIMNKDGKEVHIHPEEKKDYLDKGWAIGKPRKLV